MRITVALALIPILAGFTNDELAMLSSGVTLSPLPVQFAAFSDRIPETQAVCGFLPKLAALVLPPIS